MITPPPLSTLFPYTTLFRSGDLDAPAEIALLVPDQGRRRGVLLLLPDQLAVVLAEAVDGPLQRGQVDLLVGDDRRGDDLADRKSTRLNSSHANISYAVFCLK